MFLVSCFEWIFGEVAIGVDKVRMNWWECYGLDRVEYDEINVGSSNWSIYINIYIWDKKWVYYMVMSLSHLISIIYAIYITWTDWTDMRHMLLWPMFRNSLVDSMLQFRTRPNNRELTRSRVVNFEKTHTKTQTWNRTSVVLRQIDLQRLIVNIFDMEFIVNL